VQRERVQRAAAHAAIEAPEGGERERLEQREQRVELHAARESRELVGGEQQRGAREADASAEQARAERERERDEQHAGRGGRDAPRELAHAPLPHTCERGEPVIERGLLRVRLAVQMQQHEPTRPLLERAHLFGNLQIARLVGRRGFERAELREEQESGGANEQRAQPRRDRRRGRVHGRRVKRRAPSRGRNCAAGTFRKKGKQPARLRKPPRACRVAKSTE